MVFFDYVLGLGSNIGDGPEALRSAVRALAARGIEIIQTSALYRTPPWGDPDQDDFTNACLLVRSALAPEALLAEVKAIEQAEGRQPARRWGPRVIDIDLLWWHGGAHASERLTLPHPGILERAFVLVPLAEIAPDLRLGGVAAAEHAQRFAGEPITKIMEKA